MWGRHNSSPKVKPKYLTAMYFSTTPPPIPLVGLLPFVICFSITSLNASNWAEPGQRWHLSGVRPKHNSPCLKESRGDPPLGSPLPTSNRHIYCDCRSPERKSVCVISSQHFHGFVVEFNLVIGKTRGNTWVNMQELAGQSPEKAS